MPDRLVHKGVLQIDDDQRGARRVELGKAVLGAAAGDDPLDDGVGNGGAFQFHRDAPRLAAADLISADGAASPIISRDGCRGKDAVA